MFSKIKLFLVLQFSLILHGFSQTSWTEQLSGWEDNRSILSVTWADSQLVAVGDGGVLTSSDGKKWTNQSSNLGNNFLLRSIAWTGKQLVAVGEHGLILISSDGINWTKKESGNIGLLNSIVWTGSLLVAVGGEGKILTSNTGDDWTEKTIIRDTNQNISLNSVVWTGSELVVVGRQNSDGLILTSRDGNVWTEEATPTVKGLNSVTWTGNRLVAVGDQGPIIISNDGVTWQQIKADIDTTFPFEFNSVIWTGKLLLAAGKDRTVLISFDGATWFRQLSGNKDIYCVTWTGSQFVAVGAGGLIITSPDDLAAKVRESIFHENKMIIKYESNSLTFILPESFQDENIQATIYALSGKRKIEITKYLSKPRVMLPSERLFPGRYFIEVKSASQKVSKAFYVVQ
jgi:hypothetical protein